MVAAREFPPQLGLEPLVEPPPALENGDGRHHMGYLTGRDGVALLTPAGRSMAAVVQRIYLARLLGLADRNELSRRYGYAVRQVVTITRGVAHVGMLAPVRQRMLALGVVLPYGRLAPMHRRLIAAEALARLAVQASAMLRHPEQYRPAAREQTAQDLYLLSGAWWTDGER